MTLYRATAMSTHAHPRLLFHGGEFDAHASLRAAVTRVRETMCGIRGHDDHVRASGNRMFLRCLACGRETRGWAIDVDDTPRSRITRYG